MNEILNSISTFLESDNRHSGEDASKVYEQLKQENLNVYFKAVEALKVFCDDLEEKEKKILGAVSETEKKIAEIEKTIKAKGDSLTLAMLSADTVKVKKIHEELTELETQRKVCEHEKALLFSSRIPKDNELFLNAERAIQELRDFPPLFREIQNKFITLSTKESEYWNTLKRDSVSDFPNTAKRLERGEKYKRFAEYMQ